VGGGVGGEGGCLVLLCICVFHGFSFVLSLRGQVKDWCSKDINPKFGGLINCPFGAALLILRAHEADNDPRSKFRRRAHGRGRGPRMLGKLKHSKSSAQLETSGKKLRRTMSVIRKLRLGVVRVTVAVVTRAGMRSLPTPPEGMYTIGNAVEVVTSRGTLSFDGVRPCSAVHVAVRAVPSVLLLPWFIMVGCPSGACALCRTPIHACSCS